MIPVPFEVLQPIQVGVSLLSFVFLSLAGLTTILMSYAFLDNYTGESRERVLRDIRFGFSLVIGSVVFLFLGLYAVVPFVVFVVAKVWISLVRAFKIAFFEQKG